MDAQPLLAWVTSRVAQHMASGGSLAALARDSGVRYSWLRTFANGGIPNPGVQMVQRLADHFARIEREAA